MNKKEEGSVKNKQLIRKLHKFWNRIKDLAVDEQKPSRMAIIVIGVVAIGMALTSFSFASTPTDITISGKASGPEFYGVGAISGGGGNSRYLIDYPEPEQSQILDYLFKPGYGANLEMLKLEIGGDTNSTDGSEPSVEHTQGQFSCGSGYEFWLADQALKRNPNLKIYGLQWGAPGWVNPSASTIWTQNDVNYVINWMNCAKTYNIPITYIGGWNERSYNATWYEEMRSALNSSGYSGTKLVADDEDGSGAWNVANALTSDSTFNASVNILGVHDTCPINPTTGYSCTTTSAARSLNKPLWQSEEGGMDANSGTADMVRAVINGYIQATQTGFLEWPIIDSMPQQLPLEKRGLITADQPWSGNYTNNRMLWAIGQITQFVPAGWDYVGNANKVIGNSGSYNTWQAPNHSAWSMVAQNTGTSTTETVNPELINVTISGGLPASVVHVYETDLWSGNSSTWFVKEADIHPTNNSFSYTIPAGYVVSFTTTTGQSKGNAGTPPASQSLILPYSNSLKTNDGSQEPSTLAAQEGSFMIEPCTGGVSGSCTEQMTPTEPVYWENDDNSSQFPYAIVGDSNWSNYTVASKILFTQSSGSGGVIGRYTDRITGGDAFNGYILNVAENGQWKILKNIATQNPATDVLASGSTTSFGLNTWHTVALQMSGSNLSALIDGKIVGSASDTSYTAGLAGIQAGAFTRTWPINQYQDLSVTAIPPTATPTVVITSGITGKCLDDDADSSANDAKVDIYTCNGSAAQKWTLGSNNTIQINGKCLDIYRQGTANGSKVDLFTCNGGGNQTWEVKGSSLQNPASNYKCLDDPGSSTVNGTQLDIYSCGSNAKNQVWNT
jgi:hypothetical protein